MITTILVVVFIVMPALAFLSMALSQPPHEAPKPPTPTWAKVVLGVWIALLAFAAVVG